MFTTGSAEIGRSGPAPTGRAAEVEAGRDGVRRRPDEIADRILHLHELLRTAAPDPPDGRRRHAPRHVPRSSTTSAASPEPYRAPTPSSAPSDRACDGARPARPSLTAPATSSTRCTPPGAPLHRPGNPSDGRRTRPAHHQGKVLRLLPRLAMPNTLTEIDAMGAAITRADLDWTIARITSPNDKPARGIIRAGYLGRDRVGSTMRACRHRRLPRRPAHRHHLASPRRPPSQLNTEHPCSSSSSSSPSCSPPW